MIFLHAPPGTSSVIYGMAETLNYSWIGYIARIFFSSPELVIGALAWSRPGSDNNCL